jgi:hypothetical protein
MSEPSAKGPQLYRCPVDWVGQSGTRDDRLGIRPMAVGWAVQSRRKREVQRESEVGCQVARPMGDGMADDILAPSQLPPRPL